MAWGVEFRVDGLGFRLAVAGLKLADGVADKNTLYANLCKL